MTTLKKRITLALPVSVHEKVKMFALEKGLTIAEAIRRLLAIGLVIDREISNGFSIETTQGEEKSEIHFDGLSKET